MGIDNMEREQLIEKILDLEWGMFASVKGVNGRASCQEDKKTFLIMRRAQANIWSNDTLFSYLGDLKAANREGLNLMSVKYGRMMEVTFPDEYKNIKAMLPVIPQSVNEMACKIVKYHLAWSLEASKKYPKLFSLGRPVSNLEDKKQHAISIENYLKSELLTYSKKTLNLCLKDTLQAVENNINLSLEILRVTAMSYGYDSLDTLEKRISKQVA